MRNLHFEVDGDKLYYLALIIIVYIAYAEMRHQQTHRRQTLTETKRIRRELSTINHHLSDEDEEDEEE